MKPSPYVELQYATESNRALSFAKANPKTQIPFTLDNPPAYETSRMSGANRRWFMTLPLLETRPRLRKLESACVIFAEKTEIGDSG